MLRSAKYLCSTINKTTMTKFPYPFEYTSNVSQFKFYDPRFYEQPINHKLYPKQIQHIGYVLSNFTQLIKKGQVSQRITQYVHPMLINKCLKFRQLINEEQINVYFEPKLETFNQTMGFIQIYGLNLKQHKFIQEYKIERKNQRINFTLRERKKKQIKDENQQLKQDMQAIKQSMNSQKKKKMKELREKVSGQRQQKNKVFQKISDFLQSFGQNKNDKVFQNYILVDRIQGIMSVRVSGFQTIETKMQTRWLYQIQRQESQDIKRSRKRVLYDFQLWNRGLFIPNYQYI